MSNDLSAKLVPQRTILRYTRSGNEQPAANTGGLEPVLRPGWLDSMLRPGWLDEPTARVDARGFDAVP
ncbi:MAG TPA: hypothetical protein VFZ24_11870 [Longimicrobiales bacterium]